MPRKFRLTCARTTYFDVELAAEDSAEAERALEARLRNDPALCERNLLSDRPIYRVVDVAAAAEESIGGEVREQAA